MPKFIPPLEMRKARNDLDIYGTCMLKVGKDGRTAECVPLKDYLLVKADEPLDVADPGPRSFTLPGGAVVLADTPHGPYKLPGRVARPQPKKGFTWADVQRGKDAVMGKPLTGHDVFKPVDFHSSEVDEAYRYATGGLRHPMDCRCRDCHPEWYRSVPKGPIGPDPFKSEVNPKDAAGSKKVSFRYILWAPLILVMRALKDGARKYGPFNWRTGPKISRVGHVEAAIRHLAADLDGETIDPDSGELRTPHIAAAIAGLMVALDAESVGQLEDDRGTPGNVADMIRAETKQ